MIKKLILLKKTGPMIFAMNHRYHHHHSIPDKELKV
jgi:hypothetical protein